MTRNIANTLTGLTKEFTFLPHVTTLLSQPAIPDLIRDIRLFLLLQPSLHTTVNWANQNKTDRWAQIRNHLECLCEERSVTQANISKVDRWLTNRSLPRTSVQQHGHSLQKKYGKLCFICGCHIEGQATVDHVFPLSWGGEDSPSNLMLAHDACNKSKNNWLPGDSITWSPPSHDTQLNELPTRFRYVAFLRDNFNCTEPHCQKGIFTKSTIDLKLRIPTGLTCLDNLRTVCGDHTP